MARKKEFVPPTVEEVKQYCEERKNHIDAEYFVAYYEARGWMVGNNPMKNWQAAIRYWERNNKNWVQSENAESNKSATPSNRSGLSRDERSIIESQLQKMMLNIIDLIDKSDELKKCESPIERYMYIGLMFQQVRHAINKSLSYQQVRSQYNVYGTKYRADFIMNDFFGARLLIECDGREYHRLTQEMVNADYLREREIIKNGYNVIRFTGTEIYSDSIHCANEAWDIFDKMIDDLKDGE